MEFYNLFSTKTCEYCEKAKKLLEDNLKSYQVIYLEDTPGAKEYLLSLNLKTVPQIWVHVNNVAMFVGGYDDLVKRLR